MTSETGSRAPYPGLRSFRREESDRFFGREEFVNAMVDRLKATRFLAVLGSSGTGKSSVVKTGLLDALELGLMAKAGSSWRIAEFRPGSAPLRNLADALIASEGHAAASEADIELLRGFLARGPRSVIGWCRDGNLPAGTNLLLLVDQFEELFRYQDYARREETQALVDLLLESAHSSEFPIYVTITMRSEYLGACALVEGLAEAISHGMVLIPRMTREQCRAAIVRPAEVCGIKLEPTLVNRLLNDLASFAPWDDSGSEDQLERLVRRADQLPLLQYTLNRMWLRARERRTAAEDGPLVLRLGDYEAIGGLSGALNAHANQLLNGLAAKGLGGVVESVFRALVSGATVADAVRRPRPFGDLVRLVGDRHAVRTVVDTFRSAGCNFLTPELDPNNPKPLDDDTVIDISHESLIRQWGKLSGWLEQEARTSQFWRRLNDRRADGDLLRGRELATLVAWKDESKPNEEWAKRYGGDFGAAMAFLAASQRAEQRRRRRTAVISGVAVALAIIVPAVFLVNQLRIEKNYVEKLGSLADDLKRALGESEAARRDAEQAKQEVEAKNIALQNALLESDAAKRDAEEAKKRAEVLNDKLEAELERVKQMQAQMAELQPSDSDVSLGPLPLDGTNYADEATVFDGVHPPLVPVAAIDSPTATEIPGGRMLKTRELYDALKSRKIGADRLAFVMVDAWSDPQHTSIPSAHRLPQAGQGGTLDGEIRTKVWDALDKLSGGKFTTPIVFFSRDAKHWEGYNAALRAIEMGYSRVYWYRGGIGAWKAANQPLK